MAISVIIIVISAALFVYWLRYTCVLILRTQDARKYAHRVAAVNHLSFVQAQEQLAGVSGAPDIFENLHRSLDRDYRVVSYLLRHAGPQSEESLEEHLLRMDYHMMRVCYFLAKPFSRNSARHALIERASIISHLANAMGERVALS